ncbi:MAG: phosphatidate cytidylyltransferase, partial [Streptomycetaceae bacterium]|nr:phosphatidate cytidylyltransferase [Streptomycetaceae bacterium]
MNNSPWGGAPEPEQRSGHGPFEPYDPWAGQAGHAPGPHATQDADALRTQVIPAAGATRAQQHPDPADGVDHSSGSQNGGGPYRAAAHATEHATEHPTEHGTGHQPEDAGVTGDTPDAPQPRKSRAGRNLPAAIGVALLLGGAIVGSLLTVPVIFVGIVLAAVLVGLWEFAGALGRAHDGQGTVRLPLVPLAVGAVAMEIAAYNRGPEGLGIATALTALAVMVWRMTEGPEDYLRDMSTGVFAAFYLPFLAGFAVLMLAADDGAQRVLTFMIVVVCSDTGAYAAGVLFGSHKMAPKISPGKTWEGFAGAVVTCAVAGALCL